MAGLYEAGALDVIRITFSEVTDLGYSWTLATLDRNFPNIDSLGGE